MAAPFSPVYSETIYKARGATGSVSPVWITPKQERFVLRAIDAYSANDSPDFGSTLRVIDDATGGTVIELVFNVTDSGGPKAWRGRQSYQQLEQFSLSMIGYWDVFIFGYRFQDPSTPNP
jgi:hypothetical protein